MYGTATCFLLRPQLCRFSDACVTIPFTRADEASEKRQGTKSRKLERQRRAGSISMFRMPPFNLICRPLGNPINGSEH